MQPSIRPVAAALAGTVLLAACGVTRAGYESPNYTVTHMEERFEIRDYPAMVLASTDMAEGEDRGDGFQRLFRYISGDNETDGKIAMTTPVFVGTRAGAEASMQFVVPDDVAAAGAPRPDSAKVRLEHMEPGRYGVLRFKGSRDPQARSEALERLRERLAELGQEPAGEALFAYYDPPWTPEALRRNEVLLRLRED
jgi:hypothetical protein